MPRLALTDRAFRYRANRRPPKGERRCAFCGTRRNVEIDHVDGHEENDDPHNKIWLCRPCNTRKGIAMRNAGLGRLTRQFNPTWTGRKMTAQEREAAYAEEDREREEAERHAEWVRQQQERTLRRNNPRSTGGAKSLAQWVLATMAINRQSNAMSVSDAVQMIHDTPAWKRSEYAREIWNRRRDRGTDRTSEVPF